MKSHFTALIIICSLNSITSAQTNVIQQNTKALDSQCNMSNINYIGHRGESSTAPENTLAAFRLAWEHNAEGVELDIHLSNDNRIMVIHDGNTKRTSGADLEIKDASSEELKKLDVGVFKDSIYLNERIPFLEEVISILPEGKKLVIEIKCNSDVLPILKQMVDNSGKKAQIILISFNWDVILEAKKMSPEIPCYWLSSKKETLYARLEEAAKEGLDGLDLHYSVIDETLMTKARELSLDIIVWTVDKPDEAQRLINLGVKTITTNSTAWLRSQVNN